MTRADDNKSPYDVLGVARDADADAIKKAYRRLAHESHPDRHPDDPEAEERFKALNQAHTVLGDPERRQAYDQLGDIALDPNFDADAARAASQGFGGFPGGRFTSGQAGPGDFGSLFEDLFAGGQRVARPRRGVDLETTIELEFVDAALGCERRVDLRRPTADGSAGPSETLSVRIPPGVTNGGRIRLAGKGGPGSANGPPGDLMARIRVRPHPLFKRQGRDIHMEASISVTEAVLGTEFEVPTLDGQVMLRVPTGTDSGSKLRLRGKGIPAAAGAAAGDLYVSLRIRVPKDLDEEAKQQWKDLEAYGPTDLRDFERR
jgi:DnaJ-class molecular chaperone